MLSEKRVYALCLPEEGRTIPMVGDRVVKTLGVARSRDYYYFLPHDHEKTSASIYILCHSGQGRSPFVCTLSVSFIGEAGVEKGDCEGWSFDELKT